MDNAEKTDDLSAKEQQSNNGEAKTRKKTGGLMTRLGKNDLLRLLSILEGELEARDIYITNLQAQINGDGHAKRRYFHHSISDPFLALIRDNEVISGCVTPDEEQCKSASDATRIEPLPLLEKVVVQCKRQQVKVRQHLALSNAYYNLVNRELLQEKKKNAVNVSGEYGSAGLVQECDALRVQLQAEKAKTRKTEEEYKKLLQVINKERQRFQIIVTMLLNERKGRTVMEMDEDLLQGEMKSKYQEIILKNHDLEESVADLKRNESKLKGEIESLQKHVEEQSATRIAIDKENKLPHPANKHHPMVVAENCKDVTLVKTGTDSLFSISTNEEVKTAGYYKVAPHSTVSVKAVASKLSEQSSNIVTVKRTSSVIEKRSTKAGIGKSLSQPAFSKSADASAGSDSKYSTTLHPPERKAFLSFDASLKLSSSSIVSSPTSGAANFALNSPNEPPASGFPTPVLPAKSAKPSSAPSSTFQATRQKFQRYSKQKPSPPTVPDSNSESHSRNCVSANNTSQSTASSKNVSGSQAGLPSVSSKLESKTTKKSEQNSGFKPQPPKPPKNGAVKASHNEEVASTQVRPPPLPPKKPNLLGKSNSGKAISGRSKDQDGSRKPGTTTATRVSIPKPVVSNTKSSVKNQPASKLSMKRPTSLNTNSNNNSIRSKRFINSGKATSQLSLSAQQRLFPPQDGDDQLRSPITNTVPKSPLGSNIFTFNKS